MKKPLEWFLVRRKWWLWLAASWLVFWAVLWAFVPGWVKQELESQASQTLGRQVKVSGVEFLPWAMLLKVHGLEIADRSGQQWQFKVHELRANLELASVWNKAPVLGELSLHQPALRVRHEGRGAYDFDDLLARFVSSDKPASSEPLAFSVYNLRITDGEIDFDDAPAGRKHEVRELEFALPFISNLSSKRDRHVSPHLSLVANGQKLDLSGQATPFAEQSQADLRLQIPALRVRDWAHYWPSQLAIKPVDGALSTDLALRFVRGQGQQPNRWQLDGTVNMHAWQWTLTQGPHKGSVWTVDDMQWRSHKLAWPLANAAGASDADRPKLSLQSAWPRLMPLSASGHSKATSSFTLQVLPQQNQGDAALQLNNVRIESLRPLLAPHLLPQLSGGISADIQGQWQAPQGQAVTAQFKVAQLSLRDWLMDTRKPRPLASGRAPGGSGVQLGESLPVGFKELTLKNADVSWPLKTIDIAELDLVEPQIELGRDAQGVPNWSLWLRTAQSSSNDPSTPLPVLKLGQMKLQGGQVVWWDAAANGPLVAGQEEGRSTVRLSLSRMAGQVQALEWRNGWLSGKTAFDLQAAVAQISRQTTQKTGLLKLQGEVSGQHPGDKAQGIGLNARINAQSLPVHAIEPYLREQLHMALLHAELSTQAQLRWSQRRGHSGPTEVWAKANASLDEVRANSLNPSEELLSWKSLRWQGLEYHDQEKHALRVRVGQSTLSDFYARMIVSDAGRFNLQDVFGKKPAAVPVNSASAPVASPPVAGADPQAAPDIFIGPSTLVNGRINFSDYFIKPNYSAALSELQGQLGGFASRAQEGQVQMADLNLQGKVQGSAPLAVQGRVNPLAKPLALDIQANVRDLELPPLSPYAAKYLGYAIDRGKLQVDVNYKVQPDGKLLASNNFTLNQLTLGERVEGQGSNLPLKLAISLLKDRNGVIDVNLPVSGSVDDPDFKIGAIVWRLVLNLIGRALTSPFSLIAGGLSGGGSDQAGVVAFDAGSDRIPPASAKQLEQIVRAMQDRPVLKINLAGLSSGAAEQVDYQRSRVHAAVMAEHRRRQPDSTAVSPDALPRAEYETALKAVYSAAKIKKPRNLIGMAKDIPAAEMEALLMADVGVSDDTWRQLALSRAQRVKDHLAQAGLALERLFIVPAQVQTSPGVKLTLTTD